MSMLVIGGTMDAFCDYHPSKKAILRKHFEGVSPSSIDRQLGLVRGDAHSAIVEYWSFDKSATKRFL